jgi:hypothetical protein
VDAVGTSDAAVGMCCYQKPLRDRDDPKDLPGDFMKVVICVGLFPRSAGVLNLSPLAGRGDNVATSPRDMIRISKSLN